MTIRGVRRTTVLTIAIGISAAAADGIGRAAPQGHPSYISSALASVSVAPHSTAAWAVESKDTRAGSRAYFMFHRAGGTWHRVALRKLGAAQLRDIAAGSPKAIWAVGATSYGDASSPMIEHSTGGAFTPDNVTDIAGGDLIAVAASSPSNAWAIGRIPSFAGGTPLLAHRVGAKWEAVPDPQQKGFALNAVATSGPGNVWVLGAKEHGDNVAVWDGSALSVSRLPLPKGGVVQDLLTTGANDTWAVGWQGGKGQRLNSFTEHWNGHGWTRYRAPSPMYYSQLTGVAGAGKKVYAVGTGGPKYNPNGDETPYLVRFVHGKWKAVTTPHRSHRSAYLSISMSSKLGLAVGTYAAKTSKGEPTELSYAALLKGTKWKAVPAPH